MKSIETLYKGVKFRSRLEARYALMFDDLGIKWEYELEGFTLPSGKRYLPDFFLPEVYIRFSETPGVFFEVKPSYEKAKESESIFNSFDQPLAVACGTPDLNPWSEWLYEWYRDHEDNCMFFKFCKKCRIYEIEFSEGNYCVCKKCKEPAYEPNKWAEIVSAMKSYRF